MHKPADVGLSDEAIDWIVRLQSGSANAADETAFDLWRNTSVDHELAAQEAEAIWHGIGLVGSAQDEATRRRRRNLTRRAALGGTALTLAGLFAYSMGMMRGLLADHVTGVGERLTVELADGSVVLMNSLTSLTVDFSVNRRHLTLGEGQAVFTVAHDPGRPFVVTAAGGETRALGTVFDIDMRTDGVVVTVLEGTVAVSEASHDGSTRVAINQQTDYGTGRGVQPAREVDAQAAIAWRRGKLVFNDRPLASVIAELRRHRSEPILILNPEIESLAITGVFDLSDPGAVLQAIAETLPVSVNEMPFVTILR
ncbi:MAG: FecR family protein [Candidatus Devosia phytovorans]|uniref:FecR family protein n=1 Tax=Candidatus Devosia phytovorans TaxID=3121372 RepID=A0AAJ5VW65_9HYPH|nr:FecR family protein [Devosia sp.]WEK06026.1 MAG: FecR family protein [Devosia sp.]